MLTWTPTWAATWTAWWPWLTIAALGLFHGLNPAMGWLFAVALGLHRGQRRVVLWSLVPIALGHAAAVALAVGVALWLGSVLPHTGFARVAGAVLLGWAIWHMVRGHRMRPRVGMRAGMLGLAAWSFLMAGMHGAGLMLVPALMPGCGIALQPAGTGGPLALAAAAIGVHTAAMLAVNGAMAACIGRAAQGPPRLSIRLLVVRRALEAVERFRRPMTPKDTP